MKFLRTTFFYRTPLLWWLLLAVTCHSSPKCTLPRACTWLDEQFCTFHPSLHEYVTVKEMEFLELLKEEILPDYQNSRLIQMYANSNKMSGPLHVRINECILY